MKKKTVFNEPIDKVLIHPLERFFQLESASGILLGITTLLALFMANSPWGEMYHDLWQIKLGVEAKDFHLTKPLILWINDGLMAIFFFLIGLEIKKEILVGELNSMQKASLPIFAAIGGMAIPILIFVFGNQDPSVADGWAIPMATDIAFSLAILSLLGSRVPLGLKIFLTAFAIVDDLGAVLTIGLFYSENISWDLILYSGVLLLLLVGLARSGFYNKVITFSIGSIIWVMFLKSGIHPTVAGLLIALTVPLRKNLGTFKYREKIQEISEKFIASRDVKVNKNKRLLTDEQIHLIDDLESWTGRVQSPLQHLEHKLHSWVAYLILPTFAFANAGVEIGGEVPIDYNLALIIALALIFGNLIGVTGLSWLALKFKWANLPESVSFKQVIGVSFLAGVGFTMSMFITNLAYTDLEMVRSAKMGILAGSILAGIIGYIYLNSVLPKEEKVK